MKTIDIDIQSQAKKTQIFLCSTFLFSKDAVSELLPLASRFALFCDEEVAKLFGNSLNDYLQKNHLESYLFTFPSGEQEKSRERKAEIEDLLLSQKFNRDTCMIALGGGVTTDLIGFLASTFCRGTLLVNIPTTLLAMVDAAIGGKTGVNTRFGKNLIGAFYPANKIFIDPSILSSLPDPEWTNGVAEIIKYALIQSPELFQTIKKWTPENPVYLEKVIHECILIKAKVVEADYEESTGLRRILNFGHTIGHALELLENYQISHGEAVAIGMVVESWMSMKIGILSPQDFKAIESLIRSFPFALRIHSKITLSAMHQALSLDKKTSQRMVRFVLLEKIGACRSFAGQYCSEVDPLVLDNALNWMIAEFSGE